jgi:hypothetical protein
MVLSFLDLELQTVDALGHDLDELNQTSDLSFP